MLGILRQVTRTAHFVNPNCLNSTCYQLVRFDHHQALNMAKALVIVADGTEEMEAVGSIGN